MEYRIVYRVMDLSEDGYEYMLEWFFEEAEAEAYADSLPPHYWPRIAKIKVYANGEDSDFEDGEDIPF